MNEEEDYIDEDLIEDEVIDQELIDAYDGNLEFSPQPAKRQPSGERMYDKVRDTMIPYGFPRGSDSFATSNIKNQKINQIRATALYTQPLNIK